eukprot:CAMPEP_0119111776 /NCGR_PEP_ID=MMETSP1180-20130426/37283_1 /TAXON_ID=3052 ORGANISM="Chlamydomonas cf sp, Strain CCMP681" /NCGR_SAMPLE_ID=MMETSP1180 /ASSEMBLY_ACC=CAM_ASM_000741 /LENGTH=51 /DNA_ID=CAMNT_0007098953 /DNA_START=11 /DNA_END=162 /DNA_ORIENTATION=+
MSQRHALEQAGVPSVTALVAMLGVVLFRKVVLESQAAMEAKSESVEQLVDG